MKRKTIWMGIAGLVLALGITAVHARGHRGGKHHFAGPRFEELDLTQEQKDQLKSLRTETQKKMIQLKADMQIAHVELKELLIQKNPNQDTVDKVVSRLSSAQAKMTESRVRQKLAVNKILTEEQFQKLEEMPKGRRDRGRHFRGRRGPGEMRHRGMGLGSGSAPTPSESESRI
jgi:Spy/CpxP family protein refolding chaperone